MLKRTAIGFIVTAGFRAADVVGIGAVLGIDPRHKIHYIGSTEDEVYGTPHFPLVPSTTFARCPELDVLVVGELSAESMNDSACLEFIKNSAKKAAYVIGVSNGVVALAMDSERLPDMVDRGAAMESQTGDEGCAPKPVPMTCHG